MIENYTKVSRKTVEEDRIAICPIFGCKYLKKVKPLKLGFLGFRKYPKCANHNTPLVFIDEFIGDFIQAIKACLFDLSSLLPLDLLALFKNEAPDSLKSLVYGWMHCNPIGRGAQVVSDYIEGLSKSYMKLLSKKQARDIQQETITRSSYGMLRIGIERIGNEYADFLKSLREKCAEISNLENLRPFTKKEKNLIANWFKGSLNNVKRESPDSEQHLLIQKKYYDKILHLGTCSLLLGGSPRIVIRGLSPFELFSAYYEFLIAGLCEELKKKDIENLLMDKKTLPVQIIKPDNVASHLIKTIIEQIRINEKSLIKYHKKIGNKYTLYPRRGSNQNKTFDFNLRSQSNIAKFLGISREQVRRWLNKIDDTEFKLGRDPSQDIVSFRKIRSSIFRFFKGDGEGIKHGRKQIMYAIDCYMDKKLDDLDYITKICLLLDDCAEWNSAYAHTESVIAKKLLMKSEYLRDQRRRDINHNEVDKGYYSYSKYFNLIINLLLVETHDFHFENRVNFLHFKKKVKEILFQELVDKGVFSKELKAQYKALLYSTYALTVAQIKQYGDFKNIPKEYKTAANPKGLATFEQISTTLGFNKLAITQTIKAGLFLSQIMVAKLKALIQSKHILAPKECDIALLALDQIPLQRTIQRSSYTGTISHPILEYYFWKVLKNLEIVSHHEKFINRPHSYHRIDTFIEIKSKKQSKLIEKLDSTIINNFGLSFNGIKELLVDYNIPSIRNLSSTLDKIDKYAKQGRLLIIAFYGGYSNDIYELVQNHLDSIDYEKYNTKNIHFMDITDLAKLFSVNKEKLKKLESINELIVGSLTFREGALEDLEVLSEDAAFKLELSNTTYLE